MTAGLADREEKAVKAAAQELYRKRVEARKAAGPRSFLGEEVDSDEAFVKYLEVRDDLAGWMQLLEPVIKIRQDGQVLLPKELVERTKEFETRLRKGEW